MHVRAAGAPPRLQLSVSPPYHPMPLFVCFPHLYSCASNADRTCFPRFPFTNCNASPVQHTGRAALSSLPSSPNACAACASVFVLCLALALATLNYFPTVDQPVQSCPKEFHLFVCPNSSTSLRIPMHPFINSTLHAAAVAATYSACAPPPRPPALPFPSPVPSLPMPCNSRNTRSMSIHTHH